MARSTQLAFGLLLLMSVSWLQAAGSGSYRVCTGSEFVHLVISVCSGRRSFQDESIPSTTTTTEKPLGSATVNLSLLMRDLLDLIYAPLTENDEQAPPSRGRRAAANEIDQIQTEQLDAPFAAVRDKRRGREMTPHIHSVMRKCCVQCDYFDILSVCERR